MAPSDFRPVVYLEVQEGRPQKSHGKDKRQNGAPAVVLGGRKCQKRQSDGCGRKSEHPTWLLKAPEDALNGHCGRAKQE